MSEEAPLTRHLTADTDAVSAGSDGTVALGAAPFDGTVTGVTYTPDGTITGAATNSRTVTVVNKGQSGSGSTVVAELALVSGVNATGLDGKAIPLSGTASHLEVKEGDVLAFVSSHVGTGIADTGGQVSVEIARS